MISNARMDGGLMVKRIYLYAWVLLIAATVTSLLNGTFDAPKMVAGSLGVVGLVYAFALWAALTGGDSRALDSELPKEES